MKRIVCAVGLGAMVAGCSEVASPDAALVTAVVVDDFLYTPRSHLESQTQVVGEKYAEVVRFVDCSDGIWLDRSSHVSDHCPLENGESNYLPTGTPIHRIEGVEPGEALTVYHGDVWEVLRPNDAVTTEGAR